MMHEAIAVPVAERHGLAADLARLRRALAASRFVWFALGWTAAIVVLLLFKVFAG